MENLYRSMDSFQGLTTKSPSSWHRPLASSLIYHVNPVQDEPLTNQPMVTTSCEICSGPHDTRYCMEDPEQGFVEYASTRIDEAGGGSSVYYFTKNGL
ncbi:hypothetical protein Tco_1342375 [Tanacetum coccineum]